MARRPEFAGLAAPALLLLAAGRSQQRPPRVSLRARPSTRRAFEGELVAIDVLVEGQGACSVRWTWHPGREIEPVGAAAADGPRARFTFSPQRWGRRQIGTLDVVLRDRWRLAEGHLTVNLPSLDCYPAPAQQRTQVVLSRLPNRLGEHAARTFGEGIEFAGVREYAPGDRQRSINWPASTRRGRLQVNTFAAERSQDVVLLVDGTSDVGEPGSSALDLALRGAAAAARAYLDARDRVGVITYHWGSVGWLGPGLGRRQVYRIIDSMLASERGGAGPAGRGRPRARACAGCRGPRCPRARWSWCSARCWTSGSSRSCGTCVSAASPCWWWTCSTPIRPSGRAARTGWPGGSGGWNRRRSGSRCANSASRWCTGTGSVPSTCRWPATPAAR